MTDKEFYSILVRLKKVVNKQSLTDCERVETVRAITSDYIEAFDKKHAEEYTCKHEGGTFPSWDYVTCKDCNAVRPSDLGVASNKWFNNLEEANFYKENGKLPETL